MFKIDYVVTFLDPTDPYWLEQFKPYADKEFKIQRARYDDDGVKHLKYNFRGVAKYMPWVNNLYLVVFSESQVPEWVNRDTVKIITDDMYIPQKFRPTFNTSTKQTHFHFIPGLEEHFIWADDDQFAINPIGEDTYFDSLGNPKSEFVDSAYVFKPRTDDIWENIVWNSTEFAYIATNTPHKPNRLLRCPAFHTPHSSLKSDMTKYYEDNYSLIEKSITPCRSKENIIGYTWCMINGLKYTEKIQIKCFQVFGKNMYDEHDIKSYQEQGIQIFNLNVNGKGDYYKTQFEDIFPEKCKYEV